MTHSPSASSASNARLKGIYVPDNEDLPYGPAVYRAYQHFVQYVQTWLSETRSGTSEDNPSDAEVREFEAWHFTVHLWLFYPKDDCQHYYDEQLRWFKKLLQEARRWAATIESRELVVDALESIIATIEAYPLSRSSAIGVFSSGPAAS